MEIGNSFTIERSYEVVSNPRWRWWTFWRPRKILGPRLARYRVSHIVTGEKTARLEISDIELLQANMTGSKERLTVVFYPGADRPQGNWHVVEDGWRHISSWPTQEAAERARAALASHGGE